MDLNLLRQHIKSSTTMQQYRKLRKDNPQLNLPSVAELLKHFGKWSVLRQELKLTPKPTLSKKIIIELTKPYVKENTTMAEYIKIRNANNEVNLPTKTSIVHYFGSWRKFKQALGYEDNQRQDITHLTVAKIETLLTPHKEYLATKIVWDKYIEDKKHLPSAYMLVKYFGSWQLVRKALNILSDPKNKNVRVKVRLNRQNIIAMTHPYIHADTFITDYVEIRKKHKELALPSIQTIYKHFETWANFKAAHGYDDEQTKGRIAITQLSEAEVMSLIEPHKEHLAGTREKWDIYIDDKLDLPHSAGLIYYFGTWNTLKAKFKLPTQSANRPSTYSKEMIADLYLNYAPISFSPRRWDKFRKEQVEQLPSTLTINYYLSKEERLEIQKKYQEQQSKTTE